MNGKKKEGKKRRMVFSGRRFFNKLVIIVMTLMLINGIIGGVVFNSFKEPSKNIQVEEMSDFVRHNGSSYVRVRKLALGILERVGFNFVLNNKVLMSEDVRLKVVNDSYNASEIYLPVSFVETSSNYEFNIREGVLYKRNGFAGIWPIVAWLFFASVLLINLKRPYLWELEKKLAVALIIAISLGFLISLNTQTFKVENIRNVENITVVDAAFEDYVITSEGVNTVINKHNLNRIDSFITRAYYYITPFLNNSKAYGNIDGKRQLISPASYILKRNNLEIQGDEINRRLIYSNTTVARISRFMEIVIYHILFAVIVAPLMHFAWKGRRKRIADIMREEYRFRFLEDEFKSRYRGGEVYDFEYLKENICEDLEFGAYCEFRYAGTKSKGYFFGSFINREEIKSSIPETRILIFLNYYDVKALISGSLSYKTERGACAERLVSDVKVIKEKNLYEKGEISDTEPSIFKDSRYLTYQEADKFRGSII